MSFGNSTVVHQSRRSVVSGFRNDAHRLACFLVSSAFPGAAKEFQCRMLLGQAQLRCTENEVSCDDRRELNGYDLQIRPRCSPRMNSVLSVVAGSDISVHCSCHWPQKSGRYAKEKVKKCRSE